MRLDADADAEIWLKLEVLQPVRSFKLRGAGNAILQASDAELAGGVLTASAGNMAQGVAYAARLRGVPATIVVPEHAPQTKIDAIERYGGRVIRVPYEEWWQVLVSGRYEGVDGLFIHPVDNARVMAGNGTIGLELLEQNADFDTVVVPYGGGGLLDRHRERGQGGAAGRALLRSRARDRRAGRGDARRGQADGGRVHAVASSTARAAAS